MIFWDILLRFVMTMAAIWAFVGAILLYFGFKSRRFWNKTQEIYDQNQGKKWQSLDEYIAENNRKFADLCKKEEENEQNR